MKCRVQASYMLDKHPRNTKYAMAQMCMGLFPNISNIANLIKSCPMTKPLGTLHCLSVYTSESC